MAVNIGPRIGIEGEAQYRKEINNIIQQSKTLAAEMKALTSSFDKNNKSLSDNAKQHKLLNEQIKNQEKKVSELNSMLEKAKGKYDENSSQVLKWKQSVYEAEAQLNSLKGQLSELPSSLDLVASKMSDMGQKLEGIGNGIAGMGTMLSATITAPLVAAGTKAVSSFAEVDKTMTLTNATMANTAEEAELLNKAMEQAAANSTFGMNDAANAALNFARAGLDATQAANTLAPAMNLAAGEGGDLDTVSAGLVGTINGFGASFDDASHYADVFAAACNNSALDVNTLADSMGVAAPVFKTAGSNVEDAALALGVMANNNIEAEKAANALKTGLMRLADEQGSVKKSMEQYGITVSDIWGSNGQMKSIQEIQKNLHKSFSDMTEQQQLAAAAAIFGKNQGAAWLALINTAPEKVDELAKSIENCDGVTQEMADAMMGGFGGSIEKLKSSLDVLMTSLGRVIAQYLTPLVDKIQAAVDAFLNMDDATKNQIVKFAAIAAAIGPILLIVGKLLAAVGSIMQFAPALATAFQAITASFGGLSATALGALAPVLAIAAAVGVLVAAFMHLWNTNEEFRTNMTETWNSIKASFSGFVGAIEERLPAIQQAFQNVVDFIKPIWEGLCAMLAPMFEGAFSAISATLSALFNAIVSIIDMITGVLTGNKELFLQGLATFLTTIQTLFSTWWTLLWQTVLNFWNVVLGFLGTSVEEILTTIKTFFVNLWNLVVEKFGKVKEFVIEKFEEICEYIGSLPERFFNWGVEMIENLAAGIRSAIGSVTDAIGSVAEAIASFIHFSEPDVGPLSNFNSFMPDMMKQMAAQIEAGRAGVKVAVGHVAADIAAPMAGNTITLNNSFTFGGSYSEADGRTIARQINRQLGALYI